MLIQATMEKLKLFSRTVGLHPLTALGLFLVDWVLFGEEIATGGVGWVISLPVGVILGLAAIIIQRYAYRDEAVPAMMKGFVVGLLTAIPAPLSSMGIIPLAAFGAITLICSKRVVDGERQVELAGSTEGSEPLYRFNS